MAVQAAELEAAMNRKPIFDAVRKQVPGVFDDPGNIHALDNLLDAFGVPRMGDRRHINEAGLDLIKSFEGLRLAAYKDAVGIPTIGWGSTGAHVRMGMTITREEAETLLRDDLRRFEECVARNCPDATDNQFAAMVSLSFNIGCAAFERSTVCRMAKAGNHKRAQLAFGMWVFAGKKKLNGLVRRRAAEAALYGSEQ